MSPARSAVRHLHASPFTDALPSPVFFRVARVPADGAYPRHRHPWGEFVYAFSGVMEVEVQGRHYLVPPQYGLWLPPEVEHRGLNRQEACHCSLYVLPALAAGLPGDVCALTVDPLLRALLDHLRQHPPAAEQTAPQARLLQVLLDRLAQAERAGSFLPMSNDPLLLPILRALQDAPDNDRSVAEWAAQVHTTERTLLRRCQSELGMTLTEWRQRVRVVKAMPLLQAGHTVESIAQDLGYASASTFISMFRRRMGMTPDEYRRRDTAAGADAAVAVPSA
jgi:AraC-like DNA-binding protein